MTKLTVEDAKLFAATPTRERRSVAVRLSTQHGLTVQYTLRELQRLARTLDRVNRNDVKANVEIVVERLAQMSESDRSEAIELLHHTFGGNEVIDANDARPTTPAKFQVL